MATVKFDHKVKYNREWHLAHTVFQVDAKDLPELKRAGAIVITNDDKPEKPAEQPAGNDTPAGGETGESASESGEEQPGEEGYEDLDAEAEDDVAKLKEELLDYSLNQLTAFAKERGIDLNGKTKKAEVYNTIIAAL